jgi:hypothetical protein
MVAVGLVCCRGFALVRVRELSSEHSAVMSRKYFNTRPAKSSRAFRVRYIVFSLMIPTGVELLTFGSYFKLGF